MSEPADSGATGNAADATNATEKPVSSATQSLWGLWSQVKAKGGELENQISGYLEETGEEGNVREKLSRWGSIAGDYLDRADKRLEEMENRAGRYIKTVGQDIQHLVGDVVQEDAPTAPVTLFASDSLPSSRLDGQLQALHTTPERITAAETSVGALDARESEIDDLLAKYPELQKLLDDLVPAKLSRADFWLRYFKLHDDIVEQDRKRKELLASRRKDDDEEDVWGSSDEETESSPQPDTKQGTKQETRQESKQVKDISGSNAKSKAGPKQDKQSNDKVGAEQDEPSSDKQDAEHQAEIKQDIKQATEYVKEKAQERKEKADRDSDSEDWE